MIIVEGGSEEGRREAKWMRLLLTTSGKSSENLAGGGTRGWRMAGRAENADADGC